MAKDLFNSLHKINPPLSDGQIQIMQRITELRERQERQERHKARETGKS
jgi:hypothetical protein